MKTTTINLNEIPKFIDLNGTDWTPSDFITTLGNGLFTGRSAKLAIELDEITRHLHKGQDVPVYEAELEELIEIVKRINLYVEWCNVIIINYLTQKLAELKDGN